MDLTRSLGLSAQGGNAIAERRTLLLDAPIFLTASVSVAVFYICAQRELNPRTWMKEILLLPALLLGGVRAAARDAPRGACDNRLHHAATGSASG